MDNLRKGAEAIAQKCDENILEALHEPSKFPHLETIKLGRPQITDYEWDDEKKSGIQKATPEGLEEIDKKLRNNEFVMLAGTNPYHENTPPFEEEEKEESDRLRKIEQESASYMEEEE